MLPILCYVFTKEHTPSPCSIAWSSQCGFPCFRGRPWARCSWGGGSVWNSMLFFRTVRISGAKQFKQFKQFNFVLAEPIRKRWPNRSRNGSGTVHFRFGRTVWMRVGSERTMRDFLWSCWRSWCFVLKLRPNLLESMVLGSRIQWLSLYFGSLSSQRPARGEGN